MLMTLWKPVLISIIIVVSFSLFGAYVCHATDINIDFEGFSNGDNLDTSPWYALPTMTAEKVSDYDPLLSSLSLYHQSANRGSGYRFATSSIGTISFWYNIDAMDSGPQFYFNLKKLNTDIGQIIFSKAGTTSYDVYWNNESGTSTKIMADFPLDTWGQFLLSWNLGEVTIWYREIGGSQDDITPYWNGIYYNDVDGFSFSGTASWNVSIDDITILDNYISDPLETQTEWHWTNDIYAPTIQTCFINETCNFWFNYASSTIGATIYIIDETEPQFPDYADDATLITNTLTNELYLNPAIETIATTVDYCLWIEGDAYEATRLCGYRIDWVDYSTYIPSNPTWCDDPCGEIATTTFGGEINCGLQSFGAKMVCPATTTLESLNGTLFQLQNAFPLNVVYQTYEFVNDLKDISTSTYDCVPLKWGLDDTGACLFSTTTMDDSVGSATWTTIYTSMEMLLYVFFLIYIVRRILQFSKKSNTNS